MLRSIDRSGGKVHAVQGTGNPTSDWSGTKNNVLLVSHKDSREWLKRIGLVGIVTLVRAKACDLKTQA